MRLMIFAALVILMSGSASYAASWTGRASYYRAGGYAAAHRTLPVGTHVHVTNLHNGKSVVVIVRGRGPLSAIGSLMFRPERRTRSASEGQGGYGAHRNA